MTKAKNIFVFMTLFLCMLKVPVAYTEPINQGGFARVYEENNNIEIPDSGEANKDITETLHQPTEGQVTSPEPGAQNPEPVAREENAEVDDTQLKTKEQTLLSEKQRLSELQSEYDRNLEEITIQQQEHTDEGDAQPNIQAQTSSNEGQQPSESEPDNTEASNEIDKIISQLQEDIGGEDNSRLKTLLQTLSDEKQRLSTMELEYKNNFDDVMKQTQQSFSEEEEDTLSEEHLMTTLREETLASPSRPETFAQIPEKDLRPEGNVDFLGTADILYKLSQYEEALRVYQSINTEGTSEKDNAWILYQIANCHRNLKQFENALNTYQELLAKYSDTYLGNEARWYLEDTTWWMQWYEKASDTLDIKGVTETPLTPANAEGK